MAVGRLATHSQQIVGGFSVGVTPSQARPQDILLWLSASAELAVTSLLTALLGSEGVSGWTWGFWCEQVVMMMEWLHVFTPFFSLTLLYSSPLVFLTLSVLIMSSPSYSSFPSDFCLFLTQRHKNFSMFTFVFKAELFWNWFWSELISFLTVGEVKAGKLLKQCPSLSHSLCNTYIYDLRYVSNASLTNSSWNERRYWLQNNVPLSHWFLSCERGKVG